MEKFRNDNLNFDIYLEDHFEWIEMLGQKIKGYTGKYMVFDKYDFWQINKPFETKEIAMKYINELINCTNKQDYNFCKWCVNKGVREGSIIQFEDGKQGVILGREFAEGCLKFSLIKKDGNVGKTKRYLYGNLKYKVIKY